MDTVFKALADPTRRILLDRLYAENGQTLTKLCEYLGMSRQAVSQHLALLEQAQLVVVLWRGREKLHYLNPTPIHEIYERWISKYERHRLQALSDLKQKLESDSGLKDGGTGKAHSVEEADESEGESKR
jgi:DNA-binding transcriptional ArsR family regulator